LINYFFNCLQDDLDKDQVVRECSARKYKLLTSLHNLLIKSILPVLKKAFDAFDHEKKGCIGTEMVGTILEMLGHAITEAVLAEIIAEVDADGKFQNGNF